MQQHPDTLTTAQRRLADLAAALAAANVDVAEYFAEVLAHEAAQRKRVRGLAVVIRFNEVTQRVELLTGE